MRVMTYVPFGAEGVIIQVEADIRRGIPGIDITGLAEGAVREARERVRAAFRNSGYSFPQDRVLINLAPAGMRKDGAALDLPIALAVMLASGLIEAEECSSSLMILGELELSGRLRPVRGVLAAATAGLNAGINRFIVPTQNAGEAKILLGGGRSGGRGSGLMAAATLGEAAEALISLIRTGAFPAALTTAGTSPASPAKTAGTPEKAPWERGDFAEVRGQGRYKRALEIAAAGGHNLLVFGPPGAGKTMLAQRLPSICPPLERDEAIAVTRLYSLAGQFGMAGDRRDGVSLERGLITRPPFRAPHHSATPEGILGGGKSVRPGEISLAHLGFLFLDEAPEFRINVLQALREPLEDRIITISRAEGPVRLPADFQLILSANTCPCGRLGIRTGGEGASSCFCSPEEIHRYWRKFSGALLDRVELRIPVQPPRSSDLDDSGSRAAGSDPEKRGEPSALIARRVARALAIQRERFHNSPTRRNARMGPGQIDHYCPLSAEGRRALHLAMDKLVLSARAYHGILRVARTIADLEAAETITTAQVLEAIQHRRFGDDPYDILSCEGSFPSSNQ